MLFIPILVVHLLAVVAKLSLFPLIPRLRDVHSVQVFYSRYKKMDRFANWAMWTTGVLLLWVTSWRLLLQTWMLLSLFLYILVFVAIRYVLVRRLRLIAGSHKRLAVEELKLFRIESICVFIASLALLGGIGYLMVHKP